MIEPGVENALEPDIEGIIAKIQAKNFDEIKELSVVAQQLAKRKAPRRRGPRDPGDPFGPRPLRSMIRRRARRFRNGTAVAVIFVPAPKGPVALWQELGTEHHDAQPFIAPSVEIALRNVDERVKRILVVKRL